MDPGLQELERQGDPADEVAVVVRLRDAATPAPPGVRIVSRFADIATARVRRDRLRAAWSDPATASVKAPHRLMPDLEIADDGVDQTGEAADPPAPNDERRP